MGSGAISRLSIIVNTPANSLFPDSADKQRQTCQHNQPCDVNNNVLHTKYNDLKKIRIANALVYQRIQ